MKYLHLRLVLCALALTTLSAVAEEKEPDPFTRTAAGTVAMGKISSQVSNQIKAGLTRKPTPEEMEPYLEDGWKCTAGTVDGTEGSLTLDVYESAGGFHGVRIKGSGTLSSFHGNYTLEQGKTAWTGVQQPGTVLGTDAGSLTTGATGEELDKIPFGGHHWDEYVAESSWSETVTLNRTFCIRMVKETGEMVMAWASKIDAKIEQGPRKVRKDTTYKNVPLGRGRAGQVFKGTPAGTLSKTWNDRYAGREASPCFEGGTLKSEMFARCE